MTYNFRDFSGTALIFHCDSTEHTFVQLPPNTSEEAPQCYQPSGLKSGCFSHYSVRFCYSDAVWQRTRQGPGQD